MINYIIIAILALVIQYLLIFVLKKVSVYQQIYELSPNTHQAKGKTPSFGGIGIVVGIILGQVILRLWSPEIIWLTLLMLAFAGIGLIDDGLSIFHKSNKGFSAKSKFGLQIIAGAILLAGYHFYMFPLSLYDFLLYLFLIVGAANATNLTDGLDGLLAGTGIISFLGFYVLLMLIGEELTRITMVILISLVAFLWVNKNPAKIFMGDTGSLAIGALLAGLSILIHNPWILIPFGGIFIIETISVIMQVTSYKLTKKRIFLMAPLHHHFELLGLSEKNTVRLFWFVQWIFVSLFLVLFWSSIS